MAKPSLFSASLLAILFVPASQGAEPPKPGLQQAILKKMEGTWDTTMKMGGTESKGTATYKMDLGGLWLASTLEGSIGGQKFSGRGFDTYDAAKRKYVAVWMDSMSTTPMILEGTFEPLRRRMTMTGEGPGMDGRITQHKTVTTMPDDNTIHFAMYSGNAKEPDFTITYKRAH